MKKLVLVLILLLSIGMVGMAKVELNYFTHTSINVEGLQPGEYEQKLIDEFEALYPEVSIDLEVVPYEGDTGKLQMMIASGTPPDVVACDRADLIKYANAGVLLPFELTEEEKADFYPFALEASEVNGKMYYYPMGVRAGAMIVNRTLAEKLGVMGWLPFDREDRAWTADEFAAFLWKVNEVNKGFGWSFWYADSIAHHHLNMLLIQGFGGKPFEFVDGKFRCVINSPEVEEGINFYLGLIRKLPNAIPEKPESVGVGDMDNYYCVSQLLIEPASINQIIKEKKGNETWAGFNQGLLPYPAKEGITPSVPLDWCGYMIFQNNDPEKAKYAQLFVKYFVANAPNILEANFNSSPVMKSQPLPFQDFKDDEEIQYALNVLTKFGKDYGSDCPVYSSWKTLFQQHMQGVLTGELTVKEALELVEDKTNELLEEYYSE